MQKHKILGLTLTLALIFSLSAVAFAGEYNEAPMFKRLVAAGELPPVGERLPDEPVVVEPLEEIGTYGGTAHIYTTSVVHIWDGELVGMEPVLRIDRDYSWGIPNVVESYDLAEDGKSLILYLRQGLKWSDGYPFTADDFLWVYEYEILNEELYPNPPPWLTIEGELVKMRKIDDYTVRYDFPEPYPLILNFLSHAWGTQAGILGFSWYGSFQAAHYAKQFHPDFIGREKAIEQAKEAGYATWVEYYTRKVPSFFGIPFYPDTSPTLAAYVCVEKGLDYWIYERNPYYWKVDPEGNQLPYIDQLILHHIGDINVITGKIITGECDYGGLAARASDIPLYVANAEKGGYRMLMWKWPGNSHIELNLTSKDPVLRELFQDIRFRKAVSLAINRDEINKTIYFGLATPSSYTVPPGSEYYKEEWAKVYIDYDPDQANQFLDEMGLDKKDKEGYRLRPDGERLVIVLEATQAGPGQELIVEYCKDIGIDVRIKIETFGLFIQRSEANEIDMRLEGGEFNLEPAFSTLPQYYVPMQWGWTSGWGVEWDRWYSTGGEQGEEPPEKIMNLINWYEELKLVTTKEARIELAQKILQSHADNLWMINIVNMTPSPKIVNKNLRNFPEEVLWTWDIMRIHPFHPEQFFLKGAEPLKEASPLLYE